MFMIKRIYEAESPDDGKRILVDRLWPRGVSKEKADLYCWDKDVAPDTELRKWFGHSPDRFDEFKAKYVYELENSPEKIAAVNKLLELGKDGVVTLLYGAKDPKVNHAIVLRDYLDNIEKI